jgi:hypothetical protein
MRTIRLVCVILLSAWPALLPAAPREWRPSRRTLDVLTDQLVKSCEVESWQIALQERMSGPSGWQISPSVDPQRKSCVVKLLAASSYPFDGISKTK